MILFDSKTSTEEHSAVVIWLLFFYLLLSCADQLHMVVGIFKPKIGHLVALLFLGWTCLEKKYWIIPKPLLRGFLLILSSMFISSLFGASPGRSFGYIAVYCFHFVFYFLLPIQWLHLPRFFKIYWSSFLLVGLYAMGQVVLSLCGIYDPFALQKAGPIFRGQAWTYEPSYFALYMTPYVMFHNGVALLQNKLLHPLKLLGINLLLFFSTSTGIMVSYPTLFTCYWRIANKKNLKTTVAAFVVILGTALFFLYEMTLHTFFKFFHTEFLTHFSFLARWNGIVSCFKTFLANPFFGVGIGGVGPYLFQQNTVYDTHVETLEEFERFDPTNSFTEILASLGFCGLIAFSYLAFIFYDLYRKVMANSSLELAEKRTCTALFLSLVIMVIVLQMNQGLFRPYIWIHAAVTYGYLYSFQLKEPFSIPKQTEESEI